MNNLSSNRLLSALPADEYERLVRTLAEIPLDFNTDIYALGATIDYVYFPTAGIISLLAAVDAHSTLEVGIVGPEGMAGLTRFFGMKTSNVRAVVQGGGTAMRMTADDFDAEVERGAALSTVMLRFAHSMMTQISQSAVCYRYHPIEKRLARWLLMTADRMETNEYRITQDFLSNMLGVRREAVNRAAGVLKGKGLISYSRGSILIIDPSGLEAAACECYKILRSDEEIAMRIAN